MVVGVVSHVLEALAFGRARQEVKPGLGRRLRDRLATAAGK